MARRPAADDLAALVAFGAGEVARQATAEIVAQRWTPTPDGLAKAHVACIQSTLRAWAQARAPTGVDLAVLWTRSVDAVDAQRLSDDAPQLPIADLGRIYERLLGLSPTWDADARTVRLAAVAGHARRRSGSYYTPPRLVQCIVDAVLGPLLADATRDADPVAAVLALRVLDPACGSGHFLLVVADRLAAALAAARGLPAAGRRERVDIAGYCLFGLDLDGTAVDLCRANLWQWCGFDPARANAIRAQVRRGNALLGRGPQVGPQATATGIPDSAYKTTGADDASVARALRRENTLARRDPQLVRAMAAMTDPAHAEAVWLANAWCSAFVLPKSARPAVPTNADLARAVRGIAVAEPVHRAVLRASVSEHFFHWRLGFPEVFQGARSGFDAVVGNPPYLNQLHTDTATARSSAELLRSCTHGLVGGLADTAAAFWARVPELVRPGGMAGLVVPHSLLVTADTAPVRRQLLGQGRLRGIWVAGERAFADADVLTCAPIWQRSAAVSRSGDEPPELALQRWTGANGAAAAPLTLDCAELQRQPTWGALAADLLGIPTVSAVSAATVDDWATATADFRDQYYGLDGYVVDLPDADPRLFAPLVTAGLLDLATCHHGSRPTRLLKRVWNAPRVDIARMQQYGTLGPWIEQRQVPKVLVATQTSAMEVWVDASGDCLPSVPVLTVVPRSHGQLWSVAAALASPVASAWAAAQYSGAALALTALKLSATQLMGIPLPDITAAQWAAAVVSLQAAHAATSSGERGTHLRAFGVAAVRCHGLDDAAAVRVLQWWLRRAGLG